MDRRIAVATLLVATGVVLAANPVYLDWLLPYTPAEDAWRLTGLYYATLGLVGLVTLALGGFTLVRGWRLAVGHAVSLALAVLLLFPTYLSVGSWLVRTVRGPDVYVISLTAPLGDLFGEGLFSVVALALFFPLGVAVARRDLLAVSGLLTALVGSYVVVSLATGSPLVVLLPLVLVASSTDLLGLPFLGFLVVFGPFVVGFAYTTLTRARGLDVSPPRSSQAGDDAEDEEDDLPVSWLQS